MREVGQRQGRRLLAAGLLGGFVLAAALASGCMPHAGVSGEAWLATMSTKLKINNVDSGLDDGTPIDVAATLKAGDGMLVIPGGEAWVQLWRLRLRGSVWQLDTNGRSDLTGTVTFKGVDFEGQVATDLKLLHARAALEFLILRNASPWKINLDLGIGANIVDLNFRMQELEAIYGLNVEDVDKLLPYPALGARFEITPIKLLTLHAEIYGLSTLGLVEDVDGHIVEFRAGARLNLLRGHLGLGVQYHLYQVRVDSTMEDLSGYVHSTIHGASFYVLAKF
jgi:hypothetical protein